MTTASSIITAAFRESQIVAITGTPTTAETTEALARLNALILSLMGQEVGVELSDLTIGGTYDQSACVSVFIPANVRLVVNTTGGVTYKLDPDPHDGQRVALVDAGAGFATNNIVLDGNGRQVEGAATVTLSTDGIAREWLYRGDLGNWVRLASLATTDEMPFPGAFDDFFVTALAMRLNPRHRSDGMSAESLAEYNRQRGALQARYRKPRPLQDWGSIGLLGSTRSTASRFTSGR